MTGPPVGLPVSAVLPELRAALAARDVGVLVAPPGSGKTSLVPLTLAEEGPGRIIVTEPRRIAARAAARRMAALSGGRVGDLVGYTVRGERQVGPRTVVEVVTTGVLVRRLLRDPELPGVAAVILDECHERQLDADLALAFCVDVRATLRPDLTVLAMSATTGADRIAAVLGGAGEPAPIITADARPYPLDVVWAPPPVPVRPAFGSRVDPALLTHVAATVRRAVAERAGDLLVFLPGAREIDRVAGLLGGAGGAAVVRLHGRLDARTQDAALTPSPGRRVVLATALAESSLTVPGVRVVVDAGLARVPRTDHARGLGSLVTVPVSRAAATQRAGRAAREGPGAVYRCWSETEHARLPGYPQPEIATADLTGFALDLACWGDPRGESAALPDPPPGGAMAAATETLRALGAVDAAGRVTARGQRLASVGVHPRLARALVDGGPIVGARRAAQVVALVADDTLAGRRDDLAEAWRALRNGTDPAATARWKAEARRLEDTGAATSELPDDLAVAAVVGLAFPERLARRRPGKAGAGSWLMAGGTAVEPAPGSGLAAAEWLAVAVADREPGRPTARIRLAAVLDQATAVEIGSALRTTEEETRWADGDVVARRVERLGAILLAESPLRRPPPDAVQAALRDGLAADGLGLLHWTPAARSLRDRLAFCHRVLGAPWPDVSDAALLDRLEEWLAPALAGARNRSDLARVDVGTALRRLLPWPAATGFDGLAPERIRVPSGSHKALEYDGDVPVLAVKLQEVFGWQEAPTVAAGRVRVRLHLLSPAGRPVAVTDDLASFWRTGYREVRAELRGRYPRHPWPDDPLTAEPTRRVRPRR